MASLVGVDVAGQHQWDALLEEEGVEVLQVGI
jgi:hypothetical protein